MLDRRQILLLAAAGILTPAAARQSLAQMALPDGSVRTNLDTPLHDMSAWPAEWTGTETVLMLAYPGMTALDLVGPQYMFGSLWGATVQVVAKTTDPIVSDTRLTIVPDISFDDAPESCTILFAPGGISGMLNAMEDTQTIDFLATRGATADYVTAVCTGTLLLGQAGLLEGYKAATHWLAHDTLDAVGAQAVDARIVRDRNRITGGGVTAGLDFGLTMVKELRGERYAQAVQLLAEYAPEPPLSAGTLQSAPTEIRDMMVSMFPGFDAHVRAVAATRPL
ncbi:DJ-1/PfpI family protein [Actibacterium sp. 188UL27-1]|uniref:DJ-1/PfpI family protein n=1 Tax=Actibacterium sp. 188UL27-1 TaxID=2786961 RepID=UPI00195A969A|nr:DJ-1/PfpI family protein [Actibacterium sp. 188UL27-1]MBM7066334.1 DJ-1/PfpI family protein [Actibacterium sp. 188UL27-1]